MALTVRHAGHADLEQLVALLGVLFRIESDFDPDAARQRRGLELMMADPERRCVLVATRGDAVVGMATAQLVASTAEGALSALVEDVVVEERQRGAGIGRSLVAALERWAIARGATRLQLLADRDNAPAARFYDALGWRETRLVCRRRHPEPTAR